MSVLNDICEMLDTYSGRDKVSVTQIISPKNSI